MMFYRARCWTYIGGTRRRRSRVLASWIGVGTYLNIRYGPGESITSERACDRRVTGSHLGEDLDGFSWGKRVRA